MKNKLIILAGLTLALGCSSEHNDSLNIKASVGSVPGIAENPLLLTALSTSIYPDKGATSTLYGNEVAVRHTRTQEKNYPMGAVLYNVTWRQKADAHWFGARVPAKIFSIEQISINPNGEIAYKLYKGNPLKLVFVPDYMKRLSEILSIQPAISP